MRDIRSVAIVGAGSIGSGIAHNIASEGCSVVLVDETPDFGLAGVSRVERLLAEGQGRGLVTADEARAILARVSVGERLEAARDADLVIEAIGEEPILKRDLFARLGQVCRPEAIFATTTSSLLVADLATAALDPSRVIGLHYLHPPAKNRLVEVVAHAETSPDVFAAAWSFQERLGKVPVASADAPGFVTSRLFVAWLNEAMRLVDEGVSIPTVEAAAREAFGIGIGPFTLMNLAGATTSALLAAAMLCGRLGKLYAPPACLTRQVQLGAPWDLAGVVQERELERAAARLWGVALHVAFDAVGKRIGTCDDVDLSACIGLRWRRGPFEETNVVGLEHAARLTAEVAALHDLPQAPLLAERLGCRQPFSLQRLAVRVEEGIATITLRRPERRNALDPDMLLALAESFEALAARPDVQAIVLAGAGKAFVSDLSPTYLLERLEAGARHEVACFIVRAQDLLRQIELSPKRVLACLDGPAVGAGAELALACHTIIATSRARLSFPQAQLGLCPSLGGTQRLTRRVGKGVARYYLYSGDAMRPAELEALGMAWRVVAPGGMHEALRAAATQAPVQQEADPAEVPPALAAFAKRLAAVPVAELLEGKAEVPTSAPGELGAEFGQAIRRASGKALAIVARLTELAEKVDIESGLRAERAGLLDLLASAEVLEGLRAHVEQRTANFGRP